MQEVIHINNHNLTSKIIKIKQFLRKNVIEKK